MIQDKDYIDKRNLLCFSLAISIFIMIVLCVQQYRVNQVDLAEVFLEFEFNMDRIYLLNNFKSKQCFSDPRGIQF